MNNVLKTQLLIKKNKAWRIHLVLGMQKRRNVFQPHALQNSRRQNDALFA